MFIDTYTVSDVNEAFNRKKLRYFDASNLPPCKKNGENPETDIDQSSVGSSSDEDDTEVDDVDD
ncbi:hypothetical protein J6590_076041 [Homalodisca vitripennis]|nr:hypothetical protein J6590_076041 [Homalodisca vitripennis]